MQKDHSFQEKLEASFVALITEGRETLRNARPEELAARCGIYYHPGRQEYELPLFYSTYLVSHPQFVLREKDTGQEASLELQALAIYYFLTADGAPLQGKWVTLREVPGALHYERVFQGYSGDSLARFFRNDLGRFCTAARSLGGNRHEFGDASFAFWVLPRVPVLAVYWVGDDEFPPRGQVLFDASVEHYLTVGALTTLGARLCRLLIRAGRQVASAEPPNR